jgi:hypothetical protein
MARSSVSFNGLAFGCDFYITPLLCSLTQGPTIVMRNLLLGLSLLALVVFSGCGSRITNENVQEKVVTAEDMARAQQQMQSLQGGGVKMLGGPPERKATKPSKAGR